jgi:predicted nucleic acid-binding protein
MTFLDTGMLVGVLLEDHPEHAACVSAIENFEEPFTNSHALAETFATLTGFYKMPPGAAAELTLSLRDFLTVEPLQAGDYQSAIGEARSRGVMGGGIYDSLHATFARRKKALRIILATRRTSNTSLPILKY